MASTISAGTTAGTAIVVSGDTSGSLQLRTNGTTTAVTIDTSQNVGIGTSSPGQKLQISNTSSSGFAAIRMAADSRSYDVGVGGSTSGFQQNNWYIYDGTAAATRMVVDSSGNLQFNSGYGSAATAYGCRAWVNFNGTGTVAIRASGNVSSITDNGTGNYTVNFTTAMPDVNYSAVVGNGNNAVDNASANVTNITSASSVPVIHYEANTVRDVAQLFLSVFR